MGVAMFYHLTQRPLEETLPMLLEKSLAAGWRVAVRGVDPGRLDWLDERLWLGPEEGFLPHGRAGGAHDAQQPILLTERADLPNGASCLMSVDGAEVSAEEVAQMERVCILFDGMDERALTQARGQWRALTAAGCTAQYWSEESGRWEKKAES
ncbi:DNA polymerase III subunit chi [Salipiger sp. PrR002]|uniref:DNA polymerase III subunit chi n=1 Tax=Salipiger sp. PrR002 TaxID=2706489 RepID=UPI0013B7F50B|nr:DNA polymerase III subunit chi [Salipiger sp. PrR002]NDV99506.1 DNA polymerase III subunit chi [Salipiger sp. PrR002]NDW57152.1 DNA polymerase III subunit chi [Salipiger sp. PrR004]